MSWKFERVAGPFNRPLGGLAWDGSGMLIADITESLILRYEPRSGRVSVWRKHTNRTNGIAFAADGALFGCQEGSRRIVRYEPDGSATLTNQRMPDGRVHNHPCNLVLDSKRRIWFSDPYNAMAAWGPQVFGRLEHASVLRLEQDPAPQRRTWTIERATYDTTNPRGLAFSPDEKTLYVADNSMANEDKREVRAYPVFPDATLDKPRVMHTFGADVRGVHRGVEGLCVDAEGCVVAVGGWRRSGPGPLVYVFAPSGAVLESHPLPQDLPNNCAFGDRGLGSLYVTTAEGYLLRARRTDRIGRSLTHEK